MTMNEQSEALEVTISKRGLTVKVVGPQITLTAIVVLALLGALYLYVTFS
jgi:hypothetical protein